MTLTMRENMPEIAIIPKPSENLERAVAEGGGVVAPLSNGTSGLIVGGSVPAQELTQLLIDHPSIGWIQLPSAGIESFAGTLAAHSERTWSSAKGAYAAPVAEHVLALTLALLRRLPDRVRAKSWGESMGSSLHSLRVVVIGAGGIALEIIRLFKAFNTHITVVRRRDEAVPSADRTVTTDALTEVLASSDVVVIAAALTDETKQLIGGRELRLLKETSILVNIARGGLVDTDALVAALAEGRLGLVDTEAGY